MKHLVIAAALLLAGLAWVVFGRGGGASDPLAARDALLAGPVRAEVVSDFGARGNTIITRVDDGLWQITVSTQVFVAEQPDDPESSVDRRYLQNEHGQIAEFEPGCFGQLDLGSFAEGSDLPGISYATTLLRGIELDRDGDEVRYHLARGGQDYYVTEDLSRVHDGVLEVVVRHDTAGAGPQTEVTYMGLEGAALDSARREITAVEPSEAAPYTARWRSLDPSITVTTPAVEIAPVEVFILRDCPELLAGRHDMSMHQTPDGTWVVENAVAVDLPFDTESELLAEAARQLEPGDVPFEVGAVIVRPAEYQVEGENGTSFYSSFAMEIVSCEETDWFSC